MNFIEDKINKFMLGFQRLNHRRVKFMLRFQRSNHRKNQVVEINKLSRFRQVHVSLSCYE